MLLTAILPVLMAAAWAAPATEDSSSADLGVIGIDGVEDEEHLTDSPIGDFAPEFEFGYMENRKLERVEYLFGKRVPLDRLVKLNSFEHNYQGEKDVKLTINYPEKGNGSIITYVKVAVIQVKAEQRKTGRMRKSEQRQRKIEIIRKSAHARF